LIFFDAAKKTFTTEGTKNTEKSATIEKTCHLQPVTYNLYLQDYSQLPNPKARNHSNSCADAGNAVFCYDGCVA
jgi:hypothetical protein